MKHFKSLSLVAFASLLLISCGSKNAVESENVSIADIYLVAPDSLAICSNMTLAERQKALEGGKNSAKTDTYDEKKYPDGVAVVKGDLLYYLSIPQDAFLCMRYWDTDVDSVKLVAYNEQAETSLIYFYNYYVGSKKFESIAPPFTLPAVKEMINRSCLSDQQYNLCCRNYARHPAAYLMFDIYSKEGDLLVGLSDMVLMGDETTTYTDTEKAFSSKIIFKFNGKTFDRVGKTKATVLEGQPLEDESADNFDASKLDTYLNARYTFSIPYPADRLKPQGESQNGDGQTFLSSDGETSLIAFGSMAGVTDNGTIQGAFNDAINEFGDNLTYKKLGSNWFVLSGSADGKHITYHKTILNNGTLITFILNYPVEEKGYYDKLAKYLSENFHATAQGVE